MFCFPQVSCVSEFKDHQFVKTYAYKKLVQKMLFRYGRYVVIGQNRVSHDHHLTLTADVAIAEKNSDLQTSEASKWSVLDTAWRIFVGSKTSNL